MHGFCKIVLQSFQNFRFLARDGEFRYPPLTPHVVIQGIITNPTHCFHDGSEFLHPVSLHVIWAVANHSLCVDPYACREPGSFPTFFFPAFNFVHHCNGTGEFCLCLDCIVHEPIIHKGQSELLQHVFPCESGACTQLGITPCSPCPFIEKGLCLPRFRALKEAILYAFPPITGPRSNCQNISDFLRAVQAVMPLRGLQADSEQGAQEPLRKFTRGFFLDISKLSRLSVVKHSSPSPWFLQRCTVQGKHKLGAAWKNSRIFF